MVGSNNSWYQSNSLNLFPHLSCVALKWIIYADHISWEEFKHTILQIWMHATAQELLNRSVLAMYCRLDISRYNITRYRILYKNFDGKTLARLQTHERKPYLALKGELWLSSLSYWEKADREISGVHCIYSDLNGCIIHDSLRLFPLRRRTVTVRIYQICSLNLVITWHYFGANHSTKLYLCYSNGIIIVLW